MKSGSTAFKLVSAQGLANVGCSGAPSTMSRPSSVKSCPCARAASSGLLERSNASSPESPNRSRSFIDDSGTEEPLPLVGLTDDGESTSADGPAWKPSVCRICRCEEGLCWVEDLEACDIDPGCGGFGGCENIDWLCCEFMIPF